MRPRGLVGERDRVAGAPAALDREREDRVQQPEVVELDERAVMSTVSEQDIERYRRNLRGEVDMDIKSA